MRIGIDIRVLLDPRLGGIRTYTENILKALFELRRDDKYYLFGNSLRPIKLPRWCVADRRIVPRISRVPNKLLTISQIVTGYPYLNRRHRNLDLIFAPNIFTGKVSPMAKLVVTFHDLSWEIHPEYFTARQRLWHYCARSRKLAARADKIITVSNSTARDIIQKYHVNSDKVRVIYNGIAPPPALEGAPEIPGDYILSLATIEPRKNVGSIIRAFRLLKSRRSATETLKLVIAGSRGWMRDQISPRADIIYLGQVGEERKWELMRRARMAIFTPFYEGFGLPMVEAMSVGCPVIIGSTSALPEIAGSAALMANPYNIEEITTAMQILLQNEEVRQQLIKKGLEVSGQYSWKKAAISLAEIFDEVNDL